MKSNFELHSPTPTDPMTSRIRSVQTAARRASVLFLLSLTAIVPSLGAADANPPERMTYQGFLVDANGVALGNSAPRNYDVIFRIYDASTSGNILWAEQQTLTVDKGYFSVLLGEGSQVGSEPQPALSSLFSSPNASDRYVQITVKGIGTSGGDSTIQPRLRLLSSPYAFLARKAASAVSLMNDTNRQVVSITGTNLGINVASPTAALDVNGKARVSGPLTVNGFTNEGPSSLKGDVVVDDRVTAARVYATNSLYFSGGGNAYLCVKNIGNGDNPIINFDGSDWLEYIRSQNIYDFRIDSASKLRITSTNVVVGASGGITGYGTIPVGGIIMWSGTNVPSGWALCNGQTNSGIVTPNLSGRFVLGSGSGAGLTSRTIGQKGGEEKHALTVGEMPSHSHTTTFAHNGYPDGSGDRTDNYYIMDSSRGSTRSYSTSSAGSGAAHENMPPFYVLAYIMRVQ